MKAAVMRAFKTPLELEEISIGRPGPREVLLRTAASGVCHSDLHVIEAGLPVPPPHMLGRPERQYSQFPQNAERQPITWSPGFTCVT